jgi:hypothetical protein
MARPGLVRASTEGAGVLIRKNWGEHLPWFAFILVVSALSIYWYSAIVEGTSWEHRPSGSGGGSLYTSAPFLFGVAGGSICLFEFLLWPRKRWRVLRLGRTKVWMRAHIWLGLLAVPLLILHSSFYFRNLEANLLLLLFVIVILSGIWGLIMQQFIPQRMIDEVPAETIFSQIGHISNLLLEEADRLVIATCGPQVAEEGEPSPHVVAAQEEEAMIEAAAAGQHFTVGAVRTIGGVQGKVLQSRSPLQPVPNSEPLREFFNLHAAPYLKEGAASKSPLASVGQSQVIFNDLRLRLDTAAHEAVDALENLCDQRRQFDHQANLHWWLHNWLWVHLPLSLALIVFMFIHIWRTLQYWWPS